VGSSTPARCGASATARSAVARRWRNEPSKRDCFRAGSSRVPREGHAPASGQSSQRGIRARHTVAPRSISACAAAIANFAFDENVLPRDVNVDRVERRTGHGFTGAAAQALMDLGASVCLARIPRCDECPLAGDCPSRGTRDEPARKQSRFEGSFRQRRATALRAVADAPQRDGALDPTVVEALERDGLVVVENGLVRLPV